MKYLSKQCRAEKNNYLTYFRAVWVPGTFNHASLAHAFPRENTKTEVRG